MNSRYFYFLLLFFLSSCAGYHFNTNNNPLIGYDIKSVAVPMFVNRSVLPNMSAPMTREISLALSDYSGLKVYSGEDESADAVLLGIIESPDHYGDTVKTTQKLFSDQELKSSVGNRSAFYYPVATSFNLKLRIILIKRPSKAELDMFTSESGLLVKLHPKVVLTDTIDVSGSFSRVVAETSSAQAPGEVNFVKNKGIMEKSIQDACYQTAQTFKQVVLNAF